MRDYAELHSEEAFSELVRRHVDMVYSAALRTVCDPHLAEDVTQSTFMALARVSGRLASRPILSSWLYSTSQHLAVKVVRKEVRRRAREKEASTMNDLLSSKPEVSWESIAPHFDKALAELCESERDALVLRYFERKSAREIAEILKISEAAAQKRVNRAIEHLRRLFGRRGIAVGASGLAVVISANAVHAAPAGLATTVSSAVALGGGAIQGSTLIAATKTIAMSTIQKSLIAATVAVAAGIGIHEVHRASDLHGKLQTIQQERDELSEQAKRLQAERDDATNQLAGLLAENAQLKSNSNEKELLKLRGEVTQLRTANAQNDSNDPTDEAAKAVAAKVKQMKQWLEQNPNEKIPELQYLTAQDWLRGANYSRDWKTDDDFDRALSQLRRDAKRTFANSIGEALANYIAGNNGQLPGDISQLESYFNPPIDGTILERYQLLQTGYLSDILNNEPLIAEKAPVDDQYDTLFKISATGFSYQGTGTSWVNGSGKGNFGTNITGKIKPFERQ